ncbi:MAG: molecular chaperone HtpG [Anaerococcus sp.]|nr:molecular chaperone HtpG [Anaerococcus sp.]
MKKEFKAEAKKVMDLMINSIYTNKEIFLRELISNGSDAIDKLYYMDLKSDNPTNKDNYYIELIPNEDERTLTIRDTGIGMNEEDLVENLGTIAKSGTEAFRESVESSDLNELIGQFGVGFYSAFMVADRIVVETKKFGEDKAYKWESENAEGFEITESKKATPGTDITLYLKESGEDFDYDQFLDQYRLRELVNRYSNYIRYPIKMLVTKTRVAEDSTEDDPKYEDYKDYDILNSDKPIWKKDKKDLSDEDYENFYMESRYGFDKPLSWIHFNVEGLINVRGLIYIPQKAPFDYYSKDYKKGLELYSHGVKIMEKSEDIVDDAYSFVKGVVESDDIKLNISRETLQQDRQVMLIAKQVNKKIKTHLEDLLKNDRDKYEKFFKEFGNNIKASIYESYGSKKEDLQDLLLFYSLREDKLISLKEYKDNMKSTNTEILYAVGDSIDKIKNTPALTMVEEGRDVLLLDQRIDEFLIKMLRDYEDLAFKSINQDDSEEKEESEETETKGLIDFIKGNTPDDVVDVKLSDKLKDLPSMIKQRGDVSIEMEKNLKGQVSPVRVKADKVLEINKSSKAYELLTKAYEDDKDKAKELISLLYDQARLIEGLDIEDPVQFTKNIWKLI